MVSIICVYVICKLAVQTAFKFGKQFLSFKFYNQKFDAFTIICGIKLLSLVINYFLLSFRTLVESLEIWKFH